MIERLLACNYDAIYRSPLVTDIDPAGNLDFWRSSGDAHCGTWDRRHLRPNGRESHRRHYVGAGVHD